MADITLIPIHIVNGSEKSELPGFLGSSAPRKAARSRQSDHLVILLTLAGNAPLTAEGMKLLLERMSNAYFNFPGSVTSALKAAADTANQYLLDRNLRNNTSGRQSIGLLNLAAVHSGSLYLAHAGPVYSMAVKDGEKQVFQDASGAGKGLGLSRPTVLRYFQSELLPGQTLLITADPAGISLPVGRTFSAAEARQAFLHRQVSFMGAAMSVSEGSGKMTLAAPSAGAESPAPTIEPVQVPAVVQPSEPLPPETVPALREEPMPETRQASAAPPPPHTPPAVLTPAAPTAVRSPEAGQTAAARYPAREAPPPRELAHQDEAIPSGAEIDQPESRPASESVLKAVARTVDTGRRVRENSTRSLASFISRLLPGESGQPASLPPLTMAFFAIAVPVVVVAAALMVYFEKGRGTQYQTYYQQASEAASLTQGQTDPVMLRNAWSQTLYYLDKADAARPEQDEAFTLRQQAQQALDGLDGIIRLDYQPAILGGLAPEIDITAMAASSSDLFMLNGAKGKVMRAILTGRGYEVDPNFVCDPGPYGSNIVGELVDIATMPRGNEFNASMMAVDGNGNLLFCMAGGSPISAPLGPPDNNWGKITAIAYDSGALYVLDPPNNAVWVYTSSEGFRDRPSNYFGTSIPPLADVIDLAVNGDDLYLLHADGHATTCTASYVGGYDTKCTDPATYTDPRPGRESAPVRLTDTSFTQLRFLPPPDPSLYMLDTNSGAIYHFSLRLNLNRQLRSFGGAANPFPDRKATAFTVGTNHMAYVAFGNEVFYGLIQ